MPRQSLKPLSTVTNCKREVERALAYYQANKQTLNDLLLEDTLPPRSRSTTRRQRNSVVQHSSRAFELKAQSKAAPSRQKCASVAEKVPSPRSIDRMTHAHSFCYRQALASRRRKSNQIMTRSTQQRHKGLLDVVPADAWCYALTWLDAGRDVLCGSSALSKRVTSWLGIQTETVWCALCQRQSLEPHLLGDLAWSACYRSRFEVQRIGLVVEIGSSEVRCGAPSWNTPIALPLYFDHVQGSFELTPVTDHNLPPPPLLQQELLLADVGMIEHAVIRAASAVRHRLGWSREHQKTLPNLLLVLPELVSKAQSRQRIRQRLVSRGVVNNVYLESPALCIRERYAAEYRLHEPVIVVDIGHFRTTVSSSTHVRHQRLAGMAIANHLSRRKHERIIHRDTMLQPLVNETRPALATRHDRSQEISKSFSKALSSDMAQCADALFRPSSSGSSIAALGDSFQAVESLAKLVASVTNLTCEFYNNCRRAAQSNVVLLGGGGAALVSGLDTLLESELATHPVELGASISRRKWTVLKLDMPRHIAWHGAALLLRRRVVGGCSGK